MDVEHDTREKNACADLVREMRRALAMERIGGWAASGSAICVFLAFRMVFSLFPQYFTSGEVGHEGTNHFSIALFSLIPAVAAWRYGTKAMARFARETLAADVLGPLAKSIDPELRFDAGAHFGRGEFDASLLFDSGGEGVTTLTDSGMFRGTENGRPFAFSALKAGKKFRHGCRLRDSELFTGIFLRAGAAKEVNGYVLSVPRSTGLNPEVMRGRLGDHERQTVVEVPATYNSEFDRWFWVFASDEDAAKAFHPDIAARLLRLREERRWLPSFSHVGDTVCLALMTGRDHWRSPKSKDPEVQNLACERYYDDLALMRELVKTAQNG